MNLNNILTIGFGLVALGTAFWATLNMTTMTALHLDEAPEGPTKVIAADTFALSAFRAIFVPGALRFALRIVIVLDLIIGIVAIIAAQFMHFDTVMVVSLALAAVNGVAAKNAHRERCQK